VLFSKGTLESNLYVLQTIIANTSSSIANSTNVQMIIDGKWGIAKQIIQDQDTVNPFVNGTED
jgi:hypothetical protein